MQFAVSEKSEVQNRSESADARPEGAGQCPLLQPHSFNEEMKENTVFLYCPFKEMSVCIVGSPFLHTALTLV